VETDVVAQVLSEPAERLQAAGAELDVQFVGELCAYAAGGPCGGAGGEFVPFDEDDVVHSCGGEMVGDARADDTAAYDDDPCAADHVRGSLRPVVVGSPDGVRSSTTGERSCGTAAESARGRAVRTAPPKRYGGRGGRCRAIR
jgi:hypothetical protein